MNPKEIIIASKSKNPLKVRRFGFGTMRLTGEVIWGEPANYYVTNLKAKSLIENYAYYFF